MKPLILTLILLPTLCQANGQLYPPGFIQDAADERLHGSEIGTSAHDAKVRVLPHYHQSQYVFNDAASVSDREFIAAVRKLDKSKEHYYGN